jgi:hypothetical protein
MQHRSSKLQLMAAQLRSSLMPSEQAPDAENVEKERFVMLERIA